MNTNNLTVLILAAGYGRRMGPFSRMVNKSLIPYGDKPLIGHIIDKFPKETTKFVVACGHMGHQVKQYLGAVHSDKQLVLVDIEDYSEGNTGPATTVQRCAKHLAGGFMLIACDTLFEFNWQERMDHSWIGVYPVDSSLAKDYDWVERDGDDIVALHNKEPSEKAVDAFVGLMYAKDDTFLNNLIQKGAKENIEGFEGMNLKAHTVKRWLDFGTYEKWQELNSQQPENSFVKPDELFYHDNGRVIKYFSKEEHATSRVSRAKANMSCMPRNIKSIGSFLIHDWAPGDVLYNQIHPDLFRKMLLWCDQKVWKFMDTPQGSYGLCEKFYKVKTLERLNQFRVKYSDYSECCVVNRIDVDSIDSYLNRVDWDMICKDVKWGFLHGDLHFDNTVYDVTTEQFTAIDWRTDFAGELYGDIYYDFAKILGGIWLNYRDVKNGKLGFKEMSDYATLEIPELKDAAVYEDILRSWITSRNYNWKKVKTLVPLIYLNMSPLHESPFDKFLMALAQLHFNKVL